LTPHHRNHLKPFKVAQQIDALLSEVISAQKDYVARLCAVCEDPCCKRVTYLFDERDLIFAKVLARNGAPKKRPKKASLGCPFLSDSGCLLSPMHRPFTCHRYLCSTLEEDMTKQDPSLVPNLKKKFRVLEELRGQLWKAYVET
jgi:hypothetical protein